MEQYEDKDDGLFWMNIKDFKHYFSNTVICKVENDYMYSSLWIENRKECLVKATLEKESKGLTFSVN